VVRHKASQLIVVFGILNFAPVVGHGGPNEQSFVAVTLPAVALAAKKLQVIASGTPRSASLKFRQIVCFFFMSSSL
jgi:hypothetical protein